MLFTEAQTELLVWIIESGSGEVVFVPTGNTPEFILVIPDGPRQTASPTDFRELISQGLVRHVREQRYEVTNDGRVAYDQLRNPPPEPRPVGFRP
jgi:hypothetical protein